MKTDRKAKAGSGLDAAKIDQKRRRSSSKPASKTNGKHRLGSYEHIPVGVVECSPDGRYINVNEEFCRITGYKREELLKLGIKEITHEEDSLFDISLHERLVAGKIPFYKIEKRIKCKDGGVVWVELTRSVARNTKGKALYTIGAVLDISDRKDVERVLRESVEQLRLATGSAQMFMWEWDFVTHSYILADNFEQVIGFSTGLLSKNSFETLPGLVPAEDLQSISEAYEQAIEHRRDLHSLTCRVIHPKTGQVVWMEISAKIVYGQDGAVERMFGVAQNITESKRAEDALQLARTQAEHSADRTARLQKVTAAISEALTPQQVAEVMAHQGGPAFGAVSSSMLLLSEDGRFLELMYSTTSETIVQPYRRFPVSLNVPAAEAVRCGEPVWIESQQEYLERYPHLADQIHHWGQQAAIAIPVIHNERILGVLTFSFDRVLKYSIEDREYALTLARQGAQALERARAEDALRESEERFRALISQATAGITESDLDNRLVFVNPRFCEMLGYSVEELLGKTIWELTYKADLEENKRFFQRMLIEGKPYQFEKRFLRKDGSWLWTNVSVTTIHDSEGKSRGGVGVIVDIEKRKRAERALTEFARQQEALYKLSDQLHRTATLEDVFDAALDAILNALPCDRASILLYDSSHVMRFVAWRGLSDGYRKATDGHSPWTPDAKDPKPIRMDDVRTADLDGSLRAVIQEEGIGALAFIPLVLHGKLIGKFMIYYNAPHSFDEAELDLSLTIAHQLAFGVDRKRAEENLRASEERFRTLANVMPSMVWAAAPDGTITYANDQWFRYVGITPEQNVENWFELVLHPGDYEHYMIEWTRALETVPDEYLIEVRNRRYDGEYRWFQTRAVPARDASGKAIAWYGVSTDIHDRIEAEKRLVLLAEISEMLRNFEDPYELMHSISKAIGKHLQVKRALFNEIDLEHDREIVHRDFHRDVESVAGIHKVSDYSSVTSAEVAAGKTVVNADSKTDPRTAPEYEKTYAMNRERSYVVVPMMRDNRWVASLWVSDDAPRNWSRDEVSLLETIAERTWTVIEKLRINTALRESEQRFREIFETAGVSVWVEDFSDVKSAIEKLRSQGVQDLRAYFQENPDFVRAAISMVRILDVNPETLDLFNAPNKEDLLGSLSKVFAPETEQIFIEELVALAEGREMLRAETQIRTLDGNPISVLFTVHFAPPAGDQSRVVVTLTDITERKRAENALGIRARQQQAVAKLGELALRERDLQKVFDRATAMIAETLEIEYCKVLELLEEGNALLLRAGVGWQEGLVGSATVGAGIDSQAGFTLQAKTPVIVDDLRQERRFNGPPLLFNHGVISGMSCIIHGAGGTAWGVLGAHTTRRSPFTEDDVNFLVAMSNILGDAIQRKQAEEALRQSEERYRAVVESQAEMLCRFRSDGTILFVNEAYARARGTTAEKLIHENFWEFITEEDRPAVRAMLDGLTPEDPEVRIENRFQAIEGERWTLWTNRALDFDDHGKVLEVQSSAIDITDRKQAEEALRQSEERFVRFMQHLPGLAWIKDIDGRYVYANAAAEKAFHTPREQLYGQSDEDIFPAEVAAQFRNNDVQALMDEKGVQVIETLEHDDGVLHYSLVSKFPIPGPDGKTALIGGTAFDVTERRRAEDALRESEERFRAILRQATVGIVRKDADGRLIFVNQAFCNMLGYTEAELLGKMMWDFMHEDDITENKRSYERLMKEGVPFKLERRLLREDGSVIWVDASVSPIMNAEGKPQSAVAVEVDINARKQAEEALQQLNLQLEDRVLSRTAKLRAVNQTLREEIAERQRVEDALRKSEAAARENEEKLSTLFELLPVGISFLDPKGQIIQMNSALANILKFSKEQLSDQAYKSRTYIRANGTLMPPTEFASERALKENKTIYNVETGVILENSEVVWTSVSAAPVTVADVGAVVVTVDITESKRAERALQESRERLQVLSQRLVEVQEEERRAIARELHDRVGQTLAALNINLIIISSQMGAQVDEQISTRLNDSMKLVAETISLVRDVMSNLRPSVLDDYGLEVAIESHLSQFMSRYEIHAKFEKPLQPIARLGSSIEMTFLRIAQEALMNIVKHAHASKVTLSLSQEGNTICMTVKDDGLGITSWQEANRPGSHGLTIMRERAEAFGGSFSVSSVPGKGTTVEVRIPVENNDPPQSQKEVSS